MLQLIVEIVISVGIIALLAMALMQRKKEKKEYVKDENEEERGKYWDADEQGWSSKRERSRIQERQDNYKQTTVDMLKKQLITFVYDENPDLANLDSKGFTNLNNTLARHAQTIVQDIEKIKKDFVVK
jgi:FtsZ-interacting cell division protein ZipA